jgi:probable HAF family extracellular repeat protein
VNSRGQVVGTSESRDLCLIPTGEHAFLWEHGGPMVDLNTLIPAGSSLQLTFAVAINDRGEIAGFGVQSGCAPKDVEICGHAYVLIPCDRDGNDEGNCDNNTERLGALQPTLALREAPSRTGASPPIWQRQRLNILGRRSRPTD